MKTRRMAPEDRPKTPAGGWGETDAMRFPRWVGKGEREGFPKREKMGKGAGIREKRNGEERRLGLRSWG